MCQIKLCEGLYRSITFYRRYLGVSNRVGQSAAGNLTFLTRMMPLIYASHGVMCRHAAVTGTQGIRAGRKTKERDQFRCSHG